MNSHEPGTRKLWFGVECLFGFFDGTVGWLQFKQEVDYVELNLPLFPSGNMPKFRSWGLPENLKSMYHVAMCSLFMPFLFPDGWHLWPTPKSHCMHCILQLLVSSAAHLAFLVLKRPVSSILAPVWWPLFSKSRGRWCISCHWCGWEPSWNINTRRMACQWSARQFGEWK